MANPPAPPAVPRPAATVMVLRPAQPGLEVFMVRRPQAAKFAADVFVFPGGTVRDDDQLTEAQARELGLEPSALQAVLAAHGDPFATRADGGLALWVAALRELFEEAGVLLASEADGSPLDLAQPDRAARLQQLRGELQEGRLSLAALARQERLSLTAGGLTYFSRWITPPTSPRRYDTRFFVVELPAGQTAAHCQIETTDGLWIEPARALAEQKTGFPLMFVTAEHLRRLAEFDHPRDLLAFRRGRPPRAIQAAVDPATGRPYLTAEQEQTW